jgi:tetratricopeptide (TPR) repeat protein
MYRRHITHIFGPLVLLLAAFVGYHAWFKPHTLVLSELVGPATEEREPSPQPKPQILPHDHSPGPYATAPVPPLVAVLPGASDRIEILRGIHEDLERDDAAAARAKLATLPPGLTNDPQIRRYVAVLWNNLGVLQLRLKGTAASVDSFKRAVGLDPQNTVAHLNLAHAYWELRDPSLTEEFLTRLVMLAPDEPFPHLALADLLQEQDRLGDAVRHLDQATERAGKDPALHTYLERVSARVRRTELNERELTARASTHFSVKFDGAEDQTMWVEALEILEEAYREIGQKLGHHPSRPIIVVLHTREHFRSAAGGPGWADGLYDPSMGRIQIPTQGALTDKTWLARVLRHEFVHALLHDYMGAGILTMPTWLNEGLAMQLSGDRWTDLAPASQEEFRIIPLQALEASWSGLPTEVAAVAYFEANVATHVLLERYGMQPLRDILERLKARQSLARAMPDALSLSYEQFERQWVERIKTHVASKG